MTASSLLAPVAGGLVAGIDARARILAAIAFALVTVGLHSPLAALVAVALSVVLVVASLPPWQLLKRLSVLEGMMAVVLITLPFSVPGQALLTLGPLTASREGLFDALLIVLKAHAVVLALLGLVGSLEPAVLGHALARLGVPDKLVHLLLLTVRQIELLAQEQQRLRQAMRARAFVARSNRHTWVSYGNLVGMLLVRSLERSRRIHAAMRCRGFRGRLYLLESGCWRVADTRFLLAFMVPLGALLALDRLA